MKCLFAVFVLGVLAMGLAHGGAETVVFRVVDYQTIKGQRTVLVQPVISYDIFGYVKDNSANPHKGDVLRCAASKRSMGQTTAGDEVNIVALDCGAVSFDIAGINFGQ